MQSRPRILPSLSIALLLAGIISQAASCSLDQNGTAPPDEVKICTGDAECNDDNPCTLNTCSTSKVCEFKPIEGIAPEQTPGDCQRGTCSNGNLTLESDDQDLPADKESCTDDTCVAGAPKHSPRGDGESCTVGDVAGQCQSGFCTVECNALKPCDDKKPCTQDTCNASTGKCSFSPLDGLPTPGVVPVAGDCKQQICVAGEEMTFVDNADVLDDANSCTKDSCVNGEPMQKLDAEGTLCIATGIMGVCNATGACVQCNVAQECPEIVPANPCKQRTCTNNMCGEASVPAMDLPAAKDGDCKKPACDGNGNLVMMNDDKDPPVDGNVCTADVCTNGMPSNPPEPNTAKCGPTMMQTCDGMGKCTGCMGPTDCGVSDDCKTYSCNLMGMMGICAISYEASGKDLPPVAQTDGDCMILECDGAGNTIASIDPMDAPPDANQCTQNLCDMMGMPTYPPEPMNVMCTDKGGTLCDGLGNCLKAPGTDCGAGAECVTGFCVDGVCCNDSCTADCKACNLTGSQGVCSNVAVGMDDGAQCSGMNSCDGMGACKRNDGQACGMNMQCASGNCVEGVCCNSPCMETCKTCTRSGFVGQCIDLPNEQLDTTATMTCTGEFRCDGIGNCKKLTGYSCTAASQCLSGYCADGYCCGNICNQTCMACSTNLTGGTNGSCQPITNGTDPDNECPMAKTCDGTGKCKP